MDDNFDSEEKLYRGVHSFWIKEDDTVSSAAFKILMASLLIATVGEKSRLALIEWLEYCLRSQVWED